MAVKTKFTVQLERHDEDEEVVDVEEVFSGFDEKEARKEFNEEAKRFEGGDYLDFDELWLLADDVSLDKDGNEEGLVPEGRHEELNFVSGLGKVVVLEVDADKDGWEVLLKFARDSQEYWLDVWIDRTGTLRSNWNEYIFRVGQEPDETRNDFQYRSKGAGEHLQMFSMAAETELLKLGVIVEDEDGKYIRPGEISEGEEVIFRKEGK